VKVALLFIPAIKRFLVNVLGQLVAVIVREIKISGLVLLDLDSTRRTLDLYLSLEDGNRSILFGNSDPQMSRA
jgi:hypothetical protein